MGSNTKIKEFQQLSPAFCNFPKTDKPMYAAWLLK